MKTGLTTISLIFLLPAHITSYTYSKPAELGRAPYILDTGEPYRDIFTVESSKKAAEMAWRLKYQTPRQHFKTTRKYDLKTVTPQFQTRHKEYGQNQVCWFGCIELSYEGSRCVLL